MIKETQKVKRISGERVRSIHTNFRSLVNVGEAQTGTSVLVSMLDARM